MGVAIHSGLPVPGVGSVEAPKTALTQAHSFAYGPDSAGGTFFVELLERLQVPDARSKLQPVAGGAVMDSIAKSDADLTAITVPNILDVAGVTLAGKLPKSLQNYTTYTGAVSAAAPRSAPEHAMLRFLTMAEAAAVLARHGLDRPDP